MKFKLLVTTLALALGIATSTNAIADGDDGKIAFGPQGGIVFNDFDFDNQVPGRTVDNEIGWLAGAFVEFGLWAITLRPEVNYVVKKYEIANTADVEHRYLEIPVLLKFNPLADSVVSPFIVLGPSWSKHLSTETEYISGVRVSGNLDNIDRWDVAGVAGLGIEFNVAENVGLNLQGRYNFGFRDLDSGTQEVRSRGIYALGGVSIQY